MKDFKQNTKMACEGNHYKKGGKVKKYAGGRQVASQDSPEYSALDDETPVGKKADEAARKAYREANEGDWDLGQPNNPRLTAVKKAAQGVIQKDREQTKPFENANPMGDTYKRGGKVKRGKK